MQRRVVLAPAAVRRFGRLRARDQSLLRSQMQAPLVQSDATVETGNRFRLRRPSEIAEFELRVEQWRLFYRVLGDEVQVVLIGRKRDNFLIAEGERFIV